MYRKLAALAATAMALAVVCSLAAGGASGSKGINHQPVLDSFAFNCHNGTFVGKSASACIGLNSQWEGFYSDTYMKTGMTISVTLYLPKGSHVTKSLIKMAPPPGVPLRFKHPASDFRYKMLKDRHGVMRPVWLFHHLAGIEGAFWRFSVSVPPGQTQVRLGAVAVAVGVSGAPVQKAHVALSQQL